MGDIVKTVDRAEFEKRRRESLQVIGCPECGFGIELVIDFPIYGSKSATLRCKNCGHSVKEYLPTEYVACGNSRGFFHSTKSLAKGIFSLVDAWNTHAKTEWSLCKEKREAYILQKSRELRNKHKTEVNANA